MENSYGIGVRNRYELFYDEEIDPLDILKQTEEKKKDRIAEKENKGKSGKNKDAVSVKKINKNESGSKTIEKVSTGNNKPQQPQQQPQQQQPQQQPPPQQQQQQQQQTSQPQQLKPRTNDRVKFSDREERNNRRNKPEEIQENRESRENGVTQRFDGETRGGRGGRGSGFRGRGLRRGGRGGPGFGGDYRGKREFDRQSGMVTSGVKAVDKRDGSGSYNWGSNKEQIEEQLQADTNVELDTSGENQEKGTEEVAVPPTTEEEQQPKEEDAQREMTLDEWKALQKREKPIFKTRRPGEGENTSQWKKTYILKKKEEVEESEDEDEEDEEEEGVQHGRKKVLLPIDFQFADTPTRGRGRGRGRGGMGGGRGGRGMGGGRGRGGGGGGGGGGGRSYQGGGMSGAPSSGERSGGNHRQEAPKMDDERDFPSLG